MKHKFARVDFWVDSDVYEAMSKVAKSAGVSTGEACSVLLSLTAYRYRQREQQQKAVRRRKKRK